MKVKFTGTTSFLVLTNGKIYDVLSVERDWYRIVDDSNDDYLYHPKLFEVVADADVTSDRGRAAEVFNV
jgi:hypothetical protein